MSEEQKPHLSDFNDKWNKLALGISDRDVPSQPRDRPASPTSEGSVKRYVVDICDDCIALKGEMCHNPECVFCRRTMAEVGEILDATLIAPRIDGQRVVVQDGHQRPMSEAREEFRHALRELHAANGGEYSLEDNVIQDALLLALDNVEEVAALHTSLAQKDEEIARLKGLCASAFRDVDMGIHLEPVAGTDPDGWLYSALDTLRKADGAQ